MVTLHETCPCFMSRRKPTVKGGINRICRFELVHRLILFAEQKPTARYVSVLHIVSGELVVINR